ncbi:MAG: hypothetical protein BGO43_05215 [Gammaproteobacteria bacterium 39-13]|nr:MAG: hypothetical protein BGO43_05215 [Gammaproteobacteria bacterium 39-13]
MIALSIYIGIAQHTSKALQENYKTIAITQIVDHPSLNQARQGIVDALKEAGYHEGKNTKIIYETPQGNLSVGAQISKKLNYMQPDVIIAISTTSSQSMLAANTNHNPIVFSSVTDPIAANLVKNLDHPGQDITGTMESPPIQALLEMIERICPQSKAIGVIYNPSEANSVKSLEMIKASSMLKIVEAPVSNSMDITQAVNALVAKVDLIVLPSDNTVWSAMETLTRLTKQHGIPVFSNDPDSVSKGVTLALGYAQYEIGYDAGLKAIKILNGTTPNNIPVTTPSKQSIYINLEMARAIHLDLPEDLLAKADKVIGVDKKE